VDIWEWIVIEETLVGAGRHLFNYETEISMTNIPGITLIIILLSIPLAACVLVISALFPNRLARTKSAAGTMPGRAFGLGLVNCAFFGTIAMVLLTLLDGNRVPDLLRVVLFLPTMAVLALLGILITFGAAGVAQVIGERIFEDQNAGRQGAFGAIVLGTACALPFVGWFLLIPYIVFVGIGATILGFLQKS
jgi:hypothetical protein